MGTNQEFVLPRLKTGFIYGDIVRLVAFLDQDGRPVVRVIYDGRYPGEEFTKNVDGIFEEQLSDLSVRHFQIENGSKRALPELERFPISLHRNQRL